jgi:hypothetical protein
MERAAAGRPEAGAAEKGMGMITHAEKTKILLAFNRLRSREAVAAELNIPIETVVEAIGRTGKRSCMPSLRTQGMVNPIGNARVDRGRATRDGTKSTRWTNT